MRHIARTPFDDRERWVGLLAIVGVAIMLAALKVARAAIHQPGVQVP